MTGYRAEDLVALARYPLDAPESSAYRALLRAGRARLAEHGALALPGFVTAAALAVLERAAEALLPQACCCGQDHNPYVIADDPDLPARHPRNRAQVSDKGCPRRRSHPGGRGAARALRLAGLARLHRRVQGVPALYP